MNPFQIKNGYQFYWHNLKAIFTSRKFYGWGRKRTGRLASRLAKGFKGEVTLYEDGFIRSIGLGVDGARSFSIVKDSVGFYYDATTPSGLEISLNQDTFSPVELADAEKAIALIRQHHISKYNNSSLAPKNFLPQDKPNILVIAQTAGDASLKYGLAEQFSTSQILKAAITENPDASVFIKLHPDVLTGKKQSDILLNEIPETCTLLTENYNPISLLKQVDKVYTKTSQMGFEALILGKNVVCFGAPFYAGWGLTDDRIVIERRKQTRSLAEVFAAAYLRYSKYFNPYSQKKCDIFDVIETIVLNRQRFINPPKAGYFFGFSRWKHRFVRPFFEELNNRDIHFINPFSQTALNAAVKKGLLKYTDQAAIYIWGRRSFPEVEVFAKEQQIPIYRVEDGFVRSVSLGSDLTQPYSLVVDSQGIYFDPSQPSDLESMLNTFDFQSHPALLRQAANAKNYIVKKKLSKYNLYKDIYLELPENKKIILVPGQVADDASIQYGANGMTNLALLKAVRQSNREAHIVFKPHPDVLVGNRTGHIETDEALQFCNQIVTKVGIDSVLVKADEVHTMTSLVGFEALLRGKKVVTYGLPFYAGWGLTEDKVTTPRRKRLLELNELVAGALLLYPRYISPDIKQACDLNKVFAGLESQQARLSDSLVLRLYWSIRNKMVRSVLKILASK